MTHLGRFKENSNSLKEDLQKLNGKYSECLKIIFVWYSDSNDRFSDTFVTYHPTYTYVGCFGVQNQDTRTSGFQTCTVN